MPSPPGDVAIRASEQRGGDQSEDELEVLAGLADSLLDELEDSDELDFSDLSEDPDELSEEPDDELSPFEPDELVPAVEVELDEERLSFL